MFTLDSNDYTHFQLSEYIFSIKNIEDTEQRLMHVHNAIKMIINTEGLETSLVQIFLGKFWDEIMEMYTDLCEYSDLKRLFDKAGFYEH